MNVAVTDISEEVSNAIQWKQNCEGCCLPQLILQPFHKQWKEKTPILSSSKPVKHSWTTAMHVFTDNKYQRDREKKRNLDLAQNNIHQAGRSGFITANTTKKPTPHQPEKSSHSISGLMWWSVTTEVVQRVHRKQNEGDLVWRTITGLLVLKGSIINWSSSSSPFSRQTKLLSTAFSFFS